MCYCPSSIEASALTYHRPHPLPVPAPPLTLNVGSCPPCCRLVLQGVCDDDTSMCYCPPETKYGRREAPEGSPPGTPPLQAGRPMFWCQPATVSLIVAGEGCRWGMHDGTCQEEGARGLTFRHAPTASRQAHVLVPACHGKPDCTILQGGVGGGRWEGMHGGGC